MVAVDFCCFGSCLFVNLFGTKPDHHAVTSFTKPGPYKMHRHYCHQEPVIWIWSWESEKWPYIWELDVELSLTYIHFKTQSTTHYTRFSWWADFKHPINSSVQLDFIPVIYFRTNNMSIDEGALFRLSPAEQSKTAAVEWDIKEQYMEKLQNLMLTELIYY